jgi:AraC-like DNA-binding protein
VTADLAVDAVVLIENSPMHPSSKRQPGTQVRAAVLSHYEAVSRRLGLNPLALLSEVGLRPSVLSTPAQRIPVSTAVALLEKSAEKTGCVTFGLQMAEVRLLSDFGPISLLLTHQPSLRAALHTIVQYRHLLNESLGMHMEDAGKTTLIREEVVTGDAEHPRQATELAVGALLLIFRAILGPQWHPRTVHFTHPAPADLQVHRRVFGCPVEFDADFNGLVCLSTELDRPNTQADAGMASYAQSFMDAIPHQGQSTLLLDVRKSIYLLLPMGRASVEQIAQGLGMTVRTLQRRLDEHAVSFSKLINDVRSELAQRYIVNKRYPLGRIAEQLGYANLSSFTRWFTAQFGVTPSAMRLQALSESDAADTQVVMNG